MKNRDSSIYPERTTDSYGSLRHTDHNGDVTWSNTYGGLTKREYFAAKAMQGILAANHFKPSDVEEVAVRSVQLADELLKQLEYD